jgi:hypothetical protein
MSYSWKIILDGIDISDKVSGFTITCAIDNFCREMTIDIADATFYGSPDFSQIPEETDIEIFTKNGSSFISQGEFYIERPAITSTTQGDIMQGVWGRSITAMLAEPFAVKITKSWETQTTFFAICEEVCDLVGFTFDSAYSEIDDFVIYPYTYEAEGLYPIDIIAELAALAGALVTTDRLGHLCIKHIAYSPSVADETITDDDIATIEEKPEWPEFANRVRITPTGNLASYSIDLSIPDQCLHADATSKTKMFAQVRDPEGEPASGIVVNWSHDSITASLAYETSNTQEILIQNERQKAIGYRSFKTSIPASRVDGVWAYTDPGKATNLAAGGYTIDGETVTLTDKLAYCDQSLVVSYRAAGMAVNWLTAGPAADDVTVTADVEGQRASKVVYIENPCQCPPSIKLTAAPSSITKNEAASLLVYVEESGGPVAGRMVYMYEASDAKKGTLGWTSARVGQVSIKNEKTAARNEIAGITQCEVSMFPAAVTAVYRADADGKPTGSNIYSSYAGKVINLTTSLTTGTELVVNYTAQGAALNTFRGAKLGEANLNAYIHTTSEEGKEDAATVQIIDRTQNDGYPSDVEEDADGYGGVGGLNDDFDADDGSYCVKSDGTKVKCPEGQRCCSDGYTTDCRDPEECIGGGDIDPCYPASIQGTPDAQTLGMRFDTGLQYDCTCEQMCNNEFEVYETTQGYDDGSGKKISELALEQCGEGCTEGSPAYWEKYAELKQAALDNCIAQCQCAEGMEWDTENSPETIVAGSSVPVFVTGGRGPYTWSVSGAGYSLLAAETEIGQNQVICVNGNCGTEYDASAAITVTDACGATVTGSLRNVDGQWVLDETFLGEFGPGSSSNFTIIGSTGYKLYTDRGVITYDYRAVGSCAPFDSDLPDTNHCYADTDAGHWTYENQELFTQMLIDSGIGDVSCLQHHEVPSQCYWAQGTPPVWSQSPYYIAKVEIYKWGC